MIKIISERELTEVELHQIADIMANSQCPHESLINSIETYTGMVGNSIRIGKENKFEYNI